MSNVASKRKLNQQLVTVINKLVASNVIDDTAFSNVGHCFHIEVLRDEGIVRFSMFGDPLVEVLASTDRAANELRILQLNSWKELDIGLDDLAEAVCDVLGITMGDVTTD